jgi:dTDP-4-amino-4,6-dideoxygalactose transaminase
MTDIQASLGIHQIKKLDKFIEKRKEYVDIYNKYLNKLDGIVVPYEMPNVKHAYHLYPILLENYNREDFINKMQEKGIGCSVHFIPLHLHPFYRQTFKFKKGDFPNAEWVYEKEVSLPLYPSMNVKDVKHVISCIAEILR